MKEVLKLKEHALINGNLRITSAFSNWGWTEQRLSPAAKIPASALGRANAADQQNIFSTFSTFIQQRQAKSDGCAFPNCLKS